VQHPVDLPVAGPGQPVADLVTGGGVDRRGAVPGGEVPPGREPGDVTGLDQQPGSAGRSDPMQAGQRGPGGASKAVSSLPAALVR
jgi:hypothetical protein